MFDWAKRKAITEIREIKKPVISSITKCYKPTYCWLYYVNNYLQLHFSVLVKMLALLCK